MKDVILREDPGPGRLTGEAGRTAKSLITPRRAAYVGSAVVLLVGWLVPLLLPGMAVFDVTVAVNIVVAIAIIFTAAFAAENLQEFRRASEAEYTPVLHCQLTEVRDRGEAQIAVDVTNIGRGTAASVEVTVWWSDADLVAWLPHRVLHIVDVLRPGETSHGRLDHPSIRLVGQTHFRPDRPHLVLEVRYIDGLLRRQRERYTYQLSHEPDGRRVISQSRLAIPADLDSLNGKRVALESEAAQMTDELRLAEHGLTLRTDVSPRTLQLSLMRGEELIWGAQSGIEDPVYHLGEWLRRALPGLLEFLQSPDQAHGEGGSGTEIEGDPDDTLE